MRVVSRVDGQGRFVEDVILGEGDLPEGCVQSRPPEGEGFHSPRWTGSGWTEGGDGAEILAALKASKRAELSRAFVEANTDLYPETGPEYAVWLAVPEYAANPNADRPKAIRANMARLRERLTGVDAAATVAALEAVTWT